MTDADGIDWGYSDDGHTYDDVPFEGTPYGDEVK